MDGFIHMDKLWFLMYVIVNDNKYQEAPHILSIHQCFQPGHYYLLEARGAKTNIFQFPLKEHAVWILFTEPGWSQSTTIL